MILLRKYYSEEELVYAEKILVIIQLNSLKEMKKVAEGDERLMSLVEYLRKVNQNPEYLLACDPKIYEIADEIDRREAIEKALNEGKERGLEQGIKRGRKEGKEKGKKEEKLKIAKKLLNTDMDIKQIKKITGLTKIQIEQLKGGTK